eukprot:TRINITY_DN118565_c0_g1_i1.p1 TRINITY_DN118565_c0_g1~~TRINITY_DN118565_c0_g1_i1.p1  ORF type:complete len:169 (-),score=47.84 TRINITY_DN118565_c0_g1_i1:52-558(-)
MSGGRLIQFGFVSKNMTEASRNATRTYRRMLKSIPTVIKAYQLEYTPEQIKRKIRHDFESHKEVKDVEISDMLNFKALQELDETLNLYKTKSHITNILAPIEEFETRPPVAPESFSGMFSIPVDVEESLKKEGKWEQFITNYKNSIPTPAELNAAQQWLNQFYSSYMK